MPCAALPGERGSAPARPVSTAQPGEHGPVLLAEDVVPEDHDDVALRVLIPCSSSAEREDRHPDRLVADEPAQAGDVEDAIRLR